MHKKTPTAGIILAAGRSKRLGRPKQLLRVKGGILIERVINAALASNLDRIVLVLGYQHEVIARHLGRQTGISRLKVVISRRYREGISRSICTGLKEVMDTHPSVMFLLGDQPLVDPPAINDLLIAFRNSTRDICVPAQHKNRGNPTIFSRKFYDSIMRIQGDSGAREIIESNPATVYAFPTQNPAYFFDIDTEADLKVWKTLPDHQHDVNIPL
jgi:molybdenum cofactor cytidylyltransferase